MTDLRTAAQQALEALHEIGWSNDTRWQSDRAATVIPALKAALAEPTLQTCNCRWDGEVQVQQCTLHEAHVDAIHEWAERAKTAEKKLAALADPVQEPSSIRELLTQASAMAVAAERAGRYEGASWVADAVLEAAPPQRKPLTEEEIRAIMRSLGWDGEAPSDLLFARAVEAAHGIGGEA